VIREGTPLPGGSTGFDHCSRVIADGYFDEGAAMRLPDRAYLNLYEPGSVRALLEEAMADGVWPDAGTIEVDGWPLFDAVTPLDPLKGI
jgi:hypothetical protein